MKIFRVYCDGAFDHQRGVGAAAYSIVENNVVIARHSSSEQVATANLMEMYSLMHALEELLSIGALKDDKVMVYTDFKPICDAFEKGWIDKWMTNGWVNSEKRPVKHKGEWEALRHLYDQLSIEFLHEKRKDIKMLGKLKRDARKAVRLS